MFHEDILYASNSKYIKKWMQQLRGRHLNNFKGDFLNIFFRFSNSCTVYRPNIVIS